MQDKHEPMHPTRQGREEQHQRQMDEMSVPGYHKPKHPSDQTLVPPESDPAT